MSRRSLACLRWMPLEVFRFGDFAGWLIEEGRETRSDFVSCRHNSLKPNGLRLLCLCSGEGSSSLHFVYMLPVQDVVDDQRAEHRAGQGQIHAAIAGGRHKEAEKIGAEPYAEVKEDEERRGGLGKAGT